MCSTGPIMRTLHLVQCFTQWDSPRTLNVNIHQLTEILDFAARMLPRAS